MELKRLIALLDRASFQDRQTIAAAAARTATPASLERIARLLVHPTRNVRLGAMEIVAAARFRPALPGLLEAARSSQDEERVFAVRALAHLAGPADRAQLEPLARTWLAGDDELLRIQASALLARLGAAADAGRVPGAPAAGLTSPDRALREEALARVCAAASDPGPLLVDALLDTPHPGARLDLITALEGLGPEAMAAAAPRLLAAPDGDLVALVARALGRQMPRLPADRLAAVRAALAQACRRLEDHALARAALDECLLVAPDPPAIAWLVPRMDRLSAAACRRLAEQLAALPPDQRLAHVPALLNALARLPRRALLLSDLLRADWPRLPAPERATLRNILDRAAAAALPADLSASALARIGRLYAAVQVPGSPPPGLVLGALEARGEPEAALAAVALHGAVATEAAARRLATYLAAPAAEVRAAARAALERLRIAHVQITFTDDGGAQVLPDYRTPAGERLTATQGALTSASGERYVLDASGEPVPERATDWGGCRCCERPRALVRAPERRPTCPITNEPHLVEDGRPVLARGHPLGGCTACAAQRPLEREGDMVRCPACHTEHVRRGDRYVRRRPRRREAVAPMEREGPLQRRDLPEPPGAGELQLVEPAIAHAMAANIFLVGESAERRWIGSGVVVAREGGEVAILTNRHVVEDELADGRVVLARVRAYTIAGELVPAELRWRAGHGVDLAVVVARLQAPERVTLAPLQDGSCLVGSRLFAIGNPLGLSWSYSSGTLAAFRNWETADGLSVRMIQSHVTISPGSSGGGLYHERGHLVGINSSGITAPGGDHNFAIAMPSVLAALRRERVSFAGRPLVSQSG